MEHTQRPRAWLTRSLFVSAVALVLCCWAGAMAAAARQPWLGLELAPDGDAIRVVASHRAPIPDGARLLAMASASHGRIALRASDLVEEPDMLPGYAEWAQFYERQRMLAATARDASVTLEYDSGGAPGQVRVEPLAGRPLASLPAVFWFQLLVGATGAVVGVWVLGLRPGDRGARCLAATGLALLLAAASAAVYSTRELALPDGLFHALSTLNHVGTITFGIGLVGIFYFHPQPLGPAGAYLAVAAVFAAWGVADLAWLMPGPDWAVRAIVLVQMLAATAVGVVQWRRSRGRPLERAALRWVLLSFLVGCGLFVVLMVCTVLLRWLPPMPQGYAFGFFLLMYAGLAAGVRRYRLFDLDRWSLKVLMWVVGLLGIVVVDAALVLLRVSEALSLAGSILLVAAVYFPIRQWLWGRLSARIPAPFEVLSADIMQLAMAPAAQRGGMWRRFLEALYQPLHIDARDGEGANSALIDEGLGLAVPPRHGLPGFTLWQRDKARRLFSPADAALADQVLHIAGVAMQARDAQEQGATQERRRIAADLHDDLGSKLLSIAQTQDAGAASALAREAMEEMRLAVQGMMSGPVLAEEAVADWRAEVVGRAESAQTQVKWTAQVAEGLVMPPRLRTQATRLLREAVTNALRHSGARTLRVAVQADDTRLAIEVADDGAGLAQPSERPGIGLASMARRAHSLGGDLRLEPATGGGTRVLLVVPLDAPAAQAPA